MLSVTCLPADGKWCLISLSGYRFTGKSTVCRYSFHRANLCFDIFRASKHSIVLLWGYLLSGVAKYLWVILAKGIR